MLRESFQVFWEVKETPTRVRRAPAYAGSVCGYNARSKFQTQLVVSSSFEAGAWKAVDVENGSASQRTILCVPEFPSIGQGEGVGAVAIQTIIRLVRLYSDSCGAGVVVMCEEESGEQLEEVGYRL